MHRLASVPGGGAEADIGALVEQPAAPVLLLSSADTDLLAVDQLLEREPQLLTAELRGLNLAALAHPAQIDHYLNSTVRHARLVVVRLLGGRGHWSYGLEQLQSWAGSAPERQLLMLAGTADEEQVLAGLGTVAPELAIGLARCLREGGPANLRQVLQALQAGLATALALQSEGLIYSALLVSQQQALQTSENAPSEALQASLLEHHGLVPA